MTFPALNLLLPVVLAVHNYEQYSRYDEFVQIYRPLVPERFITRQVIRGAAIFLTVAVALLSALTYLSATAGLIDAAKVATFALLLNAIAHCLQSLRRHRLTPGSFSAIALVLPYTLAEIAAMRAWLGDSMASLLRFALVGAIAVPIVAAVFTLLSYGVLRLATRLAVNRSVQ